MDLKEALFALSSADGPTGNEAGAVSAARALI